MIFLLFSSVPGVYYAYQNSDSVGKAIVLILLLGSVATWTTMLDKAISLNRARKASKRFLARFKENTRYLTSQSLMRESLHDAGPIGAIYSEGVEKLLEFYENGTNGMINMSGAGAQPVKLSAAQFEAIEAVLERAVSHQIQELEKRIGFLGTLVSLSPFCGLFGTVWGVMMAFCGIAAAGKADFTALAPGVAGALLTTVAGLVVAIPSLVGYNILNGTIRNLTVAMDNFTEEFMVELKLEQLAIDSERR
ncbi:MAG: MotA/TolQ/ExbB proton channel family protein [Lentisphaeria bacterium]|jgi:biopolymer transport protein ExbB/TolQ|nr:MotA/TolQ/ExbB proton channel family protein [Lentisphaerota bacterium]MBO5644187.1 MotA/TolQ/ExbB proton channel family protein [Lentisphaeria bacterium]MBO5765843.1 MotA/TolQ/ExbB proton channel family protein [Lentisphaeria bacterium]MBO5900589.1 MotA/TolQ/ExbB proton channel family protein [Lentisphaeria bacterium]MBO5990815.1 MotA/TolQ/ExbB proton channel family protein [Lentisphaeria bacterium]